MEPECSAIKEKIFDFLSVIQKKKSKGMNSYWLSTPWKSDLPDWIKHKFFQVVTVLVLLYNCTTCTLTKR